MSPGTMPLAFVSGPVSAYPLRQSGSTPREVVSCKKSIHGAISSESTGNTCVTFGKANSHDMTPERMVSLVPARWTLFPRTDLDSTPSPAIPGSGVQIGLVQHFMPLVPEQIHRAHPVATQRS